ncbi:MAG: hypothetical protein JWO31_926 [Phycisphaerales bacterium]|nr:hypothetical protein [Phycisphaerales bacterium]
MQADGTNFNSPKPDVSDRAVGDEQSVRAIESAGASPVLDVPAMAIELGACRDKVRQWCASGELAGAWNVGDDGKRKTWKATRVSVDAFKRSRSARPAPPRPSSPGPSTPRTEYVFRHVPAALARSCAARSL